MYESPDLNAHVYENQVNLTKNAPNYDFLFNLLA